MAEFHYDKNDLVKALRAVGLKAGDTVFCHSNVGYFGIPKNGRSPEDACRIVEAAFQEVLGEPGTLTVPVFTYSFPRKKDFESGRSVSDCGIFSEWVRRSKGAWHSEDPMFSVAALGQKAAALTQKISNECFGKGSFWERFLMEDGVICNLNLDSGSTFIHYAEQCLRVPYRQDRIFSGKVKTAGREETRSAVFFSQDLSRPEDEASFERFDLLARERGLVRTSAVGRGAVVAIRARDTYRLIEETLVTEPYFLTKAGQKPVKAAHD